MSLGRRPRGLVLSLALALLGQCAGAGAAEVYRWVDEQGITHLSQTPPPSGGYQTLDLPPAPATDPGAGARVQRQADQVDEWQRERALRQERERADLELKAERQRRCQAARQNLTTLDNLGARGLKQPDGTSVRPSPEEAQRLRDQARAAQAQSCD